MSLRDLAAADHVAIVSDATGFGSPCVIRNPAGVEFAFTTLTSDVAEVVDPQTGIEVMGRRVTVQLLPKVLNAAQLGDVVAIADGAGKPWIVRFPDVHNVWRTYKIVKVHRDNHIGSLRCECEAYVE